jgi:Uma2 family endonuclease
LVNLNRIYLLMSLQTENRYYQIAEYLEREEKAEFKSEYVNGAIITMAGGTTNHNTISLNFCRQFPLTINGKNHEIYMGDVRLWIPRYNIYAYPDIMIILDKPLYQDDRGTTVINPLVIVEILSNSTKNYDRTDKFKYYRSIPNFQEYILVEQDGFYVEQYHKQTEGEWLFKEYENENSILPLASLDFQISFSSLYQRVDFDLY